MMPAVQQNIDPITVPVARLMLEGIAIALPHLYRTHHGFGFVM